MFNKIKCPKCGNKTSDKYEFCPHCGKQLKSSEESWGMLGKEDSLEQSNPFQNSLFGGITGGMLNKMLGSAMKMLEKEMQKDMQKTNQIKPRTNLQLYINGKKININNSHKQIKNKSAVKKQEAKILPSLSEKKVKKIQKLSPKEPKTNIRRFSDKVIYEIEMPDVKSVEDISITQLGNSIEIKALAKNKYYFKSIPIGLPIIDYDLLKGKLILELEGK